MHFACTAAVKGASKDHVGHESVHAAGLRAVAQTTKPHKTTYSCNTMLVKCKLVTNVLKVELVKRKRIYGGTTVANKAQNKYMCQRQGILL